MPFLHAPTCHTKVLGVLTPAVLPSIIYFLERLYICMYNHTCVQSYLCGQLVNKAIPNYSTTQYTNETRIRLPSSYGRGRAINSRLIPSGSIHVTVVIPDISCINAIVTYRYSSSKALQCPSHYSRALLFNLPST